jgi:hypothetical protein
MNNKHNPDIEAVGFVIYGNGIIEFANPCQVPIEFLEDAIKNYRKKKHKKSEVVACAFIPIPFKLKIKK